MKKYVINRVDLGQRVTGYEVFNPNVNGGEVLGMTPKQLSDAVKLGDVLGLVPDGKGGMKPDSEKGFRALMVKTGIGTLTSTDETAVANLMYTVYERSGENFKVISSRFGRQTFCADKIKALLDLGVVNGVVLDGDTIKCADELAAEKTDKKETKVVRS